MANEGHAWEGAMKDELHMLQEELHGDDENPQALKPLRLDYCAGDVVETAATVRSKLGEAAEAMAADWWVPASYERLSELVTRIGGNMKTSRELPILTWQRLKEELRKEASDDVGLQRMCDDPQLLKQGIEYLEAVGDVMSDARLDALLLDPVSWFASFLAHFIRDEHTVVSVHFDSGTIKRGVVSLDDVVAALREEYTTPEKQVAEVMSLVCQLELCIPYAVGDAQLVPKAFLFPCLLPPGTVQDIASHWPAGGPVESSKLVCRGHRFRASKGFLPPGMFPGLLSRFRLLREEVEPSLRLWSDCAVLLFGKARVVVRLNAGDATVDIVAAALSTEHFFVGAAKGQASMVTWMAHLIRHFFRQNYECVEIEEAWLCPSPACHGMNHAKPGEGVTRPCANFFASEFPVQVKRHHGEHSCEADGCWHQIGVGHKIDDVRLKNESELVCHSCHQTAHFSLRKSF
jgi:hypothetical protein